MKRTGSSGLQAGENVTLGLEEERRENVTLTDISETLSGGGVPVLLTDASALGDEETPHWIVVTGVDEKSIDFNNPLAESGSSLPLSEFRKINGFHGEQTVVSVFGK